MLLPGKIIKFEWFQILSFTQHGGILFQLFLYKLIVTVNNILEFQQLSILFHKIC
jgi:hypothetical protein